MKTKKEDVLNFLVGSKTEGAEKFNQAFELFRKSDNRNPTQERSLNKTGYSETTLNTVLYELQKLHGISENDLRKAKKALAPAISLFREAFLRLEEAAQNTILQYCKFGTEFEKVLEFAPEKTKDFLEKGFDALNGFIQDTKTQFVCSDNLIDFELKSLLLEKSDAIVFPEELNDDILVLTAALTPNPLAENEEAEPSKLIELSPTVDQTKEKLTEAFITAPDEVKNEIKFRDEFPFISDPDLPAELKQLVTEKFNHYYAFADAHTTLSGDLSKQTLTQDEIFQLAKKAVENFKMDQLIRDEFVHYKENKKVLGVHPIFKQRKLQETVNLMTTAELAKRAPLLENYIRRDKGKSEKAANEADKAKYADKVTEWEFELALVNVRLGNSVAK